MECEQIHGFHSFEQSQLNFVDIDMDAPRFGEQLVSLYKKLIVHLEVDH